MKLTLAQSTMLRIIANDGLQESFIEFINGERERIDGQINIF